VSAGDTASADRTTIEFPAGEGYRSVGRLVLGGIASRFELPIDRVDDLLLAVDSLLLQETTTDTFKLEAEATPSGLLVRMSPFPEGRLADPAIERVLTRLVDGVVERRDGASVSVELVVSASYRDETT
jgi:hypothetical protein